MRERLKALLKADRERLRWLDILERQFPEGWIGAGFVRTAVLDHLHGRAAALGPSDIDVIWFDKSAAVDVDLEIEAQLRAAAPEADWSVKNQARMHVRNSDAPYASCEDALRFWPETATAVAVRLTQNELEILAPYGLEDLFGLRLRPTPPFMGEKRMIFDKRLTQKQWLKHWPRLRLD